MKKSLISTLVASLSFTSLSHSEIVARFDVGSSSNNSQDQEGAVQEGWADVNPSNASSGVTQNGITLTIADPSIESRNRTGPVISGNPLELVFSDFLFTRDSDGEVPVTFSGLRPNVDYEIITYAYDSSGGNNETGSWYLGSVAPENLQHTWTSSIATLDDPGDIFRLTGTADADGELVFVTLVDVANMRINGFEVNELAPALTTPELSDLTYDPATGNASVTISGIPNDRFKLVESSTLDFANPDEDPISLTNAITGTIENGVDAVADEEGIATVEFNLDSDLSASFIRAERLP